MHCDEPIPEATYSREEKAARVLELQDVKREPQRTRESGFAAKHADTPW
jgi:hypothetical protein